MEYHQSTDRKRERMVGFIENTNDPPSMTMSSSPLDGLWKLIRILRCVSGFPFTLNTFEGGGYKIALSPKYACVSVLIYIVQLILVAAIQHHPRINMSRMFYRESGVGLQSYTDKMTVIGAAVINIVAIAFHAINQFRHRKSLEKLLASIQDIDDSPGKINSNSKR